MEIMLTKSDTDLRINFKSRQPRQPSIDKLQDLCAQYCPLYLVGCSGAFKGKPGNPFAEIILPNVEGGGNKEEKLVRFKQKAVCKPKLV